jgi:hypothetical protein
MRRGMLFLLLVAFAGFYFTGHLDRLLYPVGLNFHECKRNGLGATFCGTELDEYREKVAQPIQRTSENLKRLQQEGEERAERAKAAREAEAGQRQREAEEAAP